MNPKLWGHNPWSIVSWGKRSVGPEVASPEVVRHDVTGAISLGHSALRHDVSEARRRGEGHHWGNIPGAGGRRA